MVGWAAGEEEGKIDRKRLQDREGDRDRKTHGKTQTHMTRDTESHNTEKGRVRDGETNRMREGERQRELRAASSFHLLPRSRQRGRCRSGPGRRGQS